MDIFGGGIFCIPHFLSVIRSMSSFGFPPKQTLRLRFKYKFQEAKQGVKRGSKGGKQISELMSRVSLQSTD